MDKTRLSPGSGCRLAAIFAGVLLILGPLLYSVPVLTSFAQDEQKEHVTVFVVDVSGSMVVEHDGGLPPSDPNGLRCSAVRMFADLAGPKDLMGVVYFPKSDNSSEAEPVVVPSQPLGESNNPLRGEIKKQIVCRASGNTPLADGLNKAYNMLAVATDNGSMRTGSVVLITDGLPRPQPDKQWKEIEELLPKFKMMSWRIDTIELNFEDEEFEKLTNSEDHSNGKAYKAKSALDLEPYLLDIYARQAGKSKVVLAPRQTISNAQPLKKRIVIPPFSQRLDLIAVKSSATVRVILRRPGGEEVKPQENNGNNDVLIASDDPHYVIYSINNPIEGDWMLEFEGEGEVAAEMLVASSLAIKLESPNLTQPQASNYEINLVATLTRDNAKASGTNAAMQAELVNDRLPEESYLISMAPDGNGNFTASAPISSNGPDASYSLVITAKVGDVELAPFLGTLVVKRVPEPVLQETTIRALRGDGANLAISMELDGKVVPPDDLNLRVGMVPNNADSPETPLEVIESNGTDFLVNVPNPQEHDNRLAYHLDGKYHGVVLNRKGYLTYKVEYKPVLKLALMPDNGPYAVGEEVEVALGVFQEPGKPMSGIDSSLRVQALLDEDTLPYEIKLEARQDLPGTLPVGTPAYNYTGVFSSDVPGTFGITARYTADGEESTTRRNATFTFFPRPVLSETVPIAAKQWPVLEDIYTWPFYAPIAAWAIPGASNREITVSGEVLVQDAPYSDGSVVASVAYEPESGAARVPGLSQLPEPSQVQVAAAVVKQDKDSHFTITFRPPVSGTYVTSALWTGTYQGRKAYESSDEGSSALVTFAILQPAPEEWVIAILITLLWTAMLLVVLTALWMGIRWAALPKPPGGLLIEPSNFKRLSSRPKWWNKFLTPNYIAPEEVRGMFQISEDQYAIKSWWAFEFSLRPPFLFREKTYILDYSLMEPEFQLPPGIIDSGLSSIDEFRAPSIQDKLRARIDDIKLQFEMQERLQKFLLILQSILLWITLRVIAVISWLWHTLVALPRWVLRTSIMLVRTSRVRTRSFIKAHLPWPRAEEKALIYTELYDNSEPEVLPGTYYADKPPASEFDY